MTCLHDRNTSGLIGFKRFKRFQGTACSVGFISPGGLAGKRRHPLQQCTSHIQLVNSLTSGVEQRVCGGSPQLTSKLSQQMMVDMKRSSQNSLQPCLGAITNYYLGSCPFDFIPIHADASC